MVQNMHWSTAKAIIYQHPGTVGLQHEETSVRAGIVHAIEIHERIKAYLVRGNGEEFPCLILAIQNVNPMVRYHVEIPIPGDELMNAPGFGRN